MTTGMRTNGRPINRDDLEAAFHKVVGEGRATASRAMPQALVVAGAGALSVITFVYWAGKRRGRRKSSVVEIRRL